MGISVDLFKKILPSSSCSKSAPVGFSNCTVWALCLLSLVTQVTECGKIAQDWDFAFPHHHQVLFYSVNGTSTRETQDLKLPVPSFLTRDSSWVVITGGLRNNNSNTDAVAASNFSRAHDLSVPDSETLWDETSIIKLALDPKRELIFFASKFVDALEQGTTFISAFNVTSNQSFVLLERNMTAGITDLLYLNDSLFWSETESNVIWRLNVSNEIRRWPKEPEIFFELPRGKILALTVDKRTGIFYWTNGLQDTIEYLNGTTVGEVAQIQSPRTLLTIDGSHLYWAKYPDGSSYVERIQLTNFSSRERVLIRRDRQLHSIAILCSGDMILTDEGRSQVKISSKKNPGWSSTLETVFDDHGRGHQVSIDVLSRSFALHDWQYCVSSTSGSPTTETSPTTPVSEISYGTTTDEMQPPHSPVPTFKFSKNEVNSPVPHTSSSSSSSSPSSATQTVTTLAPGGDDETNGASSVVHMGTSTSRADGAEKPEIVVVTPPPPFSSHPVSLLSENSDPEQVATSPSSSSPQLSSHNSSSSSSVPQTPQLQEISWCPLGLTNPCKGGEICVRVSNRTLCINLPVDVGAIHTEVSSAEGQSSDTSVHFEGHISLPLFIAISSALSFLVVILTATVIYMYVRLRRLDKKPRIRRRVIVSRNNQRERGSSVCELIDIENCCNMNECETACYEREAHSSKNPKSNGHTSTKDDKQKLIEI